MAEWIELYPRATDPHTPIEPPRFFLHRRVPGQPLAGLQWQAAPPLSYEDPYYVKIGNPAQMKLLRGKIVRAFEASVTVRSGTETRGSDPENPGRYPLVMQLFGGNVGVPDPNNPQRRVPPKLEWKMQRHPNPEYGWIGADLKQSVSFPDTSLPIGGFFDDPRLGDVDQTNAFWPGGQSEVPFAAYTQTGPGDPPRWGISAASIRVLVDGLPKVTVDIPSSVPVGGVVKGRIRIRYPSGDPVVGLPLGIGGFGQVSHRTINGTWGRDAFFNTDDNGEAHFELRGEYASNTYVQIVIRGTANEWANWYDPPLSNYTHQIMVAAPPGQPQPEGDCYTIPADPGQPYIPSRVEQVPQAAWDAGANSEIELEGDVSLRFNMRRATGVVLGLTNDRENVTDRARITHGFFFTSTANGGMQAQVIESARTRTSTRTYNEETLFEVRRVEGQVTYWVDGVLAYASRVPSAGQVSVGSVLYATGDVAPPFVEVEQPPATPLPFDGDVRWGWGADTPMGGGYVVSASPFSLNSLRVLVIYDPNTPISPPYTEQEWLALADEAFEITHYMNLDEGEGSIGDEGAPLPPPPWASVPGGVLDPGMHTFPDASGADEYLYPPVDNSTINILLLEAADGALYYHQIMAP